MPPIGDKGRKEVAVLISTSRRVYAGWIDIRDVEGQTIRNVRAAQSARYWGTTDGVAQLAVTGPTSESKLDAAADMLVVNDVCVVRPLTEAAITAWGMTS